MPMRNVFTMVGLKTWVSEIAHCRWSRSRVQVNFGKIPAEDVRELPIEQADIQCVLGGDVVVHAEERPVAREEVVVEGMNETEVVVVKMLGSPRLGSGR